MRRQGSFALLRCFIDYLPYNSLEMKIQNHNYKSCSTLVAALKFPPYQVDCGRKKYRAQSTHINHYNPLEMKIQNHKYKSCSTLVAPLKFPLCIYQVDCGRKKYISRNTNTELKVHTETIIPHQ